MAAGPVPVPSPLGLDDDELLRQCRLETCRSSGPGGQHANKTDSAVRLTHLPTTISVVCQDHREQARNRVQALANLRLALALELRGVADPAWLERWRQGNAVIIGSHHPDYPKVAAVALDTLAAHAGMLVTAAQDLGLSTSQLVKLLAAEPRVRQASNRIRALHGQGMLHG